MEEETVETQIPEIKNIYRPIKIILPPPLSKPITATKYLIN